MIRRDEPNAYAIPGGGVGVTRGLLKNVESETGLAMVLGYELGHHQGRHPLKRIGHTLVFTVAEVVLFGADSSSVVEASLTMAELGYSRRQEREADAFGLNPVHEVYGHTDGSLEFFEKIQGELGTGDVRWTAFVRNHPLTSNRMENMRQLHARLETGD
jgi:predicted Zn-dependent protease